MGVNYTITHTIKNGKNKTKEEITDIITKKLLKIILNTEKDSSVALNNSENAL